MCFVVTCWERADLLALVYGVWLWVCHFTIGTWLYRYLIFAPLLTYINLNISYKYIICENQHYIHKQQFIIEYVYFYEWNTHLEHVKFYMN